MNEKTDAPLPSAAGGPAPRKPAAAGKPGLALFIATACGMGYIPIAPGTWGSLAGVLIYAWTQRYYPPDLLPEYALHPTIGKHAYWNAVIVLPLALLIAAVGVWASNRAARFSGQKDPQFVVVDEVSGQMFTYLLAVALGNWKYLLLCLILFRLFDIWKPFPARQAESLPGGWGIMADDWVAGVYAAIGLWIARAAGL
jgi:phosphatidylglycerophosphatase A